MIRKNLRISVLFLAMMSGLFTGCSFLPKQQEEHNVLVVKSELKSEFEMGMVLEEDIINSQTVYCQYKQTSGENYSFGLDKKTVKALYVSVGDIVSKGDLLAELDLGNIDDELLDIETSIKKTKLESEYLKKDRKLNKELQQLYYDHGKITYDTLLGELNSIDKVYYSQEMRFEDSLYIYGLKQDELVQERNAGRIYAGMDGIVTYVNPSLLRNESNAQDVAITVMDNSVFAFTATTEFASKFKEGEIVTITTANEQTYNAMVSHDRNQADLIYFNLTIPDFELKVGTRGNVKLILDKKESCLSIPTEALRKGEDFYYVYYENEDGIKSMKKITIGIQGNGKTEVTGGLKAGDIVIIK